MCFATTNVDNPVKTWQKEKTSEKYVKFIYRKGMEVTIVGGRGFDNSRHGIKRMVY